jgi:non-ribosomal peptide synthetase component E (peptide arylation enzyme)
MVAETELNEDRARMSSDDPNAARYAETGLWGRVTLDALFKRNLARAPDRPALVDAPDRDAWNGTPPRRLTYRQADMAISMLALRLQELGLKPGTVVGLQMPNVVEAPLAMLAALRVGLVPAVLPLLWRSREVARALEPLTPKALITIGRAGTDRPADMLRYAAAELFSVRYVLAFGTALPDGVVSIEDCVMPFVAREPRPVVPAANPADEPALITFRATAAGQTAVLRSHNHWVTAGLATVLEGRMEPGETIASAIIPASLGSLATGFLPWLLTGGTLVLAQPFDPSSFAAAVGAERAAHAVLPGPLLADIAPHLPTKPAEPLKSLIALFSDARRLAERTPCDVDIGVIDVACFDEWGVVARQRKGRLPQSIPSGALRQPMEGGSGPVLLETRFLASGRLVLRGPMVPYDPHGDDGFRTTGIVGAERDGCVFLERRADGVAYVGGLGVGTDEIETVLMESDEIDAVDVLAVPDPLFGERIEARVAPRSTAPGGEDAVIERLQARLAELDLAPHKVPSRIVVDHMVRSDPRATLRSQRPAR